MPGQVIPLATGWRKIELSSGRNFMVELFSETDLVHRSRLGDDCGGVLNSLSQQWERIKRFGLSSFGQFFRLLRWTHRFCMLGCKCPNTGNALSAVLNVQTFCATCIQIVHGVKVAIESEVRGTLQRLNIYGGCKSRTTNFCEKSSCRCYTAY